MQFYLTLFNMRTPYIDNSNSKACSIKQIAMQVWKLEFFIRVPIFELRRTLPSSATSLLPSIISSTKTTNCGLKAIFARNAKQLNEVNTIKKNTKETSKIKLEYHCNSLNAPNYMYTPSCQRNQVSSKFMKLHQILISTTSFK